MIIISAIFSMKLVDDDLDARALSAVKKRVNAVPSVLFLIWGVTVKTFRISS